MLVLHGLLVCPCQSVCNKDQRGIVRDQGEAERYIILVEFEKIRKNADSLILNPNHKYPLKQTLQIINISKYIL